MTRRAVWRAVLAESDDIVHLEGSKYFPAESLHEEYFRKSSAWYFGHPIPCARRIKSRVAFWGGIEIQSIDEEQRCHGG